MHVKVNDTVMVIAGKHKGTTGTITQVLPKRNRVVVEGVNIVTKHQKANQAGQTSGRVQFEAPIHASNVLPVDPKTNKPTRVGYKVDEKSGKKVRYAKVSGEILDK